MERLATELGATKGSFYWHFKNRSTLVDAALQEWERRDTDQLIERASELDDPRERLRWLFRVVFSDGGGVGVDTALLADAEDPIVAAALERVAKKRLGYIEAQYKAMGVKAASDRAVLTYTAFVGLGPAATQHALPRSPGAALDQVPLHHHAAAHRLIDAARSSLFSWRLVRTVPFAVALREASPWSDCLRGTPCTPLS